LRSIAVVNSPGDGEGWDPPARARPLRRRRRNGLPRRAERRASRYSRSPSRSCYWIWRRWYRWCLSALFC